MSNIYSSPYRSPYKSAYATPYNDGLQVKLLAVGDSWLANGLGFVPNLPGVIPSLTIYQEAVSGYTLYDTGEIVDTVAAIMASPEDDYTAILIDGGFNDFYEDAAGWTLEAWKLAYIQMIDSCFNAGFYNVIVMSCQTIQDVFDLPNNVWSDAIVANPAIPSMIVDMDAWLEAYCASVGAKWVNINQLPFADGSYYPEAGMCSAAHPTALGRQTLASMFAPYISSPAIQRTSSMGIILDRPNRHLLTVEDMTNIETLISGIGSDWSNTVEIWLLNQADATAAGNALTGLKTGAVMLPRSGGAGTTVETVTHDSTSGAKGVALSTTEYLRTTIVPSGRTLAMGAVIQSLSSYIGNTFMGVEQSFGSNIFEVGFVSDTDIRGRGLTGSWSTSTTNPSTTSGKFIEMRMVQSGSDQIQSLYESGVVTAGPTTATYSGTVPTFEIALGGVNFGGTYSTTAVTKTIGAFAVTNGTHNALTYATAVEAATA